MGKLSAQRFWQMSEEELSTILDKNFCEISRRRIRFYAPSFMYYKTSFYCSSSKDFPTISVTGSGCALKCKHCGGVVLDTMYPATTPDQLYELCVKLKKEGALGCLISGGCLPNGSVPLAKFLDVFAEIKRDLDLTLFIHTGVIDLPTARALKKAGVDAALLDIIGSEETIREIYNLNISLKDYENSLKALREAALTFVPHVIVGLHYGHLKGEFDALRMIAKFDPSALVIIAFMPIHKTRMATVTPPTSIAIARVITSARMMFPTKPLVLGCMRPRGKTRSETEILAVKAGVDAIAFPTEETVKFAKNEGFDMSFSSLCCSQIYADMKA
jgi:lipoyl synthase